MARAPSDAIVPAPAPVPPPSTPISASADPSIPSSDVIVPMLQSIHHNIFLVMQTFLLGGGGEAPAAQEPRTQVAEDTLEAREAKDTPEVEAEADVADTPMEAPEEASGTTKADIDDDYVANVTTVQETWDPWPTSAQDD
ncbi:hypothetical protein GmHk_13G039172 [Glycine max]|nr:hypothetical protein GmHk_13G039172 [Glycine max]